LATSRRVKTFCASNASSTSLGHGAQEPRGQHLWINIHKRLNTKIETDRTLVQLTNGLHESNCALDEVTITAIMRTRARYSKPQSLSRFFARFFARFRYSDSLFIRIESSIRDPAGSRYSMPNFLHPLYNVRSDKNVSLQLVLFHKSETGLRRL
jgi:hypothetical protein